MAARVIGEYVVLEELARGGSGAVFRARHPSLGEDMPEEHAKRLVSLRRLKEMTAEIESSEGGR